MLFAPAFSLQESTHISSTRERTLTFKSLMVNVDTCMSAFYIPRQLSDAMLDYFRQSGSMIPQKFFGKARVTTTYHGYSRRSTIKGFGTNSARNSMIRTDKFGKVSVEKHFLKSESPTVLVSVFECVADPSLQSTGYR